MKKKTMLILLALLLATLVPESVLAQEVPYFPSLQIVKIPFYGRKRPIHLQKKSPPLTGDPLSNLIMFSLIAKTMCTFLIQG